MSCSAITGGALEQTSFPGLHFHLTATFLVSYFPHIDSLTRLLTLLSILSCQIRRASRAPASRLSPKVLSTQATSDVFTPTDQFLQRHMGSQGDVILDSNYVSICVSIFVCALYLSASARVCQPRSNYQLTSTDYH